KGTHKKSNKQILFNKIYYLMWICHFVLIRAIRKGADACKNRAKLLKKFKNGYSGKCPFNVAHPRRKGPGRVQRALYGRVGLTQKNFFLLKNACFGRKSRIGRFFKRKKLPKIYHTTD
ncbi:MAG: hypothetical protein ACI3ZO_09330, partial [Candidatus Cryptobacteroides sp.]